MAQEYSKRHRKDHISEINSVKLIRIREIGCPDYDSASIKYCVTAESISELENAIRFVIKTANPSIESHETLDINIERDRTSIYELIELSEKSNSILKKRPEIEHFWDYERNGVLKPEQVSFSSLKVVKFICPEGHRWENKVRNFYTSPKCPICSKREIKIRKRQINMYNATSFAFIGTFDSIKSICDYLEIDYTQMHRKIARVCSREQKTLMGKYILRNANDDEFGGC